MRILVSACVTAAAAVSTFTPTSAPSVSPIADARAACHQAATVHVRPGDAVVHAVQQAGPGATVCFAAGIYRLRVPLRPRAGQTLIGDGRRDGEQAVLSGSRRLQAFRRTAGGWVVGGQRQQGERNGECEGGGRACTMPDDVCRDGVRLRRVLSLAALRPGSFFFDYGRNQITVYDDPRGHLLEAMVAPTAILSRPGRVEPT